MATRIAATSTATVDVETRPRLIRLMTADEFSRLPETNKICELIHGEVFMAPAPLTEHQWTLGRLYRLVDDFVEGNKTGIAFFSPFDVELNAYEVYQPDIVVISRQAAANLTKNGYRGAPQLIMEVLSPSNRKHDLVIKAAEYANAGVPEYWVVDPENDRIEVYQLEGGAYSVTASTEGVARSVVLAGFHVAPADIFAMPDWMMQPPAAAREED